LALGWLTEFGLLLKMVNLSFLSGLTGEFMLGGVEINKPRASSGQFNPAAESRNNHKYAVGNRFDPSSKSHPPRPDLSLFHFQKIKLYHDQTRLPRMTIVKGYIFKSVHDDSSKVPRNFATPGHHAHASCRLSSPSAGADRDVTSRITQV
jgi:hypothetical protein